MRLPVHRGPAAWSTILPGQGPARPLTGSQRADIAIVGGGFAGLAAARRLFLADRSLNIAVLDAGRLAEGAAGRNSGFMIDLPHDLSSDDYAGKGENEDRAMIALNRLAIGFTRDAVADYGINPAYFDPAGKINGAASEAGDRLNQSYAEHLHFLGEESRRLDAKDMHDITGSRHYVSGLYTPGTVMLQPAGLVRGLGDGLTRDGVMVFENSPVTELVRDGSGWRLTSLAGTLTADKVILANNGHLESFGFASRRLMHVFLYASMTVDLDAESLKALGGQSRWGVTPSDPMGTTMRRIDSAQGGNRIITRTCAEFLPDMNPSEASLSRTARTHRQKFADRFPALAGVQMEYCWAGHLCLTWNGVEVMRELEPGLYSACGCNGLGTVRSTLLGIAAADLALGKPSHVSAHFLAEEEPKKLTPEPFASIGANLFLRYKEWRAGKE